VHWGYHGHTGPNDWGNLDPDFALCKNGKFQSPINIPLTATHQKNTLKISYQPATMMIMNDGPTTLTLGHTQTIINTGHSIQLNFPTNTHETFTLNHASFRLVQFHMHSPSENKLNGKSYPLEIHFVHQGKNNDAAVIAVFAKIGKENPTIEKIISHLPKEQHTVEKIVSEHINPANLLPEKQHYYQFAGSLTTPPCSEGIEWIVMEEPITVSMKEVLKLIEAAGGTNARPVQGLNNRDIFYSE
jgi:carbonic anhydrase